MSLNVFLISFKALVDATKRCVIVFRSPGVSKCVANLAQSRLIDDRSTLIIHKSFSSLAMAFGILRLLLKFG
jgi:hypothetical protein